jgi:Fe-S-cluster containining protein
MTDKVGCKCTSCKDACSQKPGWFLPEEAELLAGHLGVSFEEVFKTKLAVDWWEGDSSFEDNVFVLSPNVVGGDPGEEFDADPRGTCVFFVNGECSIHEVKPFECRSLMHTDSSEEVAARHLSTAHAWDNPEAQDQIKKLMGREPVALEYQGSSTFGSIFESWY